MEAMSSAMKTMRDKEPRHRQRREGISKENWRKLIKAHKSQTLIRRSGCEITNPTTESHVDSLLKGQTHTGEHVLQIIREAIDTKKRNRYMGNKKLFAEKLRHVYCADKTHEWEKCPRRKQNEEPKCKNCWENGIKTEANHEAFSNKCKVRQKWDEIARSRIAYC
ncbi:hypothetical protein EVAR_25533_1 [Eumeta japonica]|uniref:Uncharacterized protein n=1 Tax=Eumeta variegata TaxID=151549 RepID=A0A4C1VNI1_EUMVA|nr:hypothetical protein EVAR_25533_1 [Eumeta japonica]